ncbi:MAG: GAF domain-containing sensor histidine kinase, partial [Deltaproteobacteria bacterium]|nr:GAF domain-containing sensor histidine kinase [Deltaproteobacteria bacterium]
MAKDPVRPYPERFKAADLHGFLGAPLFSRDGKPLGVIFVITRAPREFSQREIELIEQFANGAAIAIQNARLFEEIHRKSKELEALVDINKGIAALLDREVLLPRIAEEARSILKVDSSIFRLIEGEDLVLAGVSDPENLSFQPRLRIGESLTGKIIEQKRVLAVTKILEDPDMIEEHREIVRRAGYHSFLGVPLLVGGQIIGTINFYSKEEREFRSEEIDLISGFADQAAIAIQNANLFAEVKEKTIELEKLNQDLQEANRAKGDFLAAMSHELRTPLNVIIGNAGLVKDGIFGDVSDKQKKALTRILHYSEALLRLINDVLTFTRMEVKEGSLRLSTFEVNEVIAHAQGYVEQLNRNGHLKILWKVEPNLAPMTTDALKLEEILQNLIGNAFKFTPEGKIEVRVRDLRKKNRVEFAVSDTGIGIDEKDLPSIFDQFHQLKGAHTGSYNGVGLGLSIVKKYLEMMHGDIHVKSQPGKGSTFTFILPYTVSNTGEVCEESVGIVSNSED